jgi:HlyD family secretion protein
MGAKRLWVLVFAIVGCTTHAEAHPAGAPLQRAAERSAIRAEGQVVAYPGADVTVGSEVMGRIVSLPVKEKSVVHKGDLIVELDASETRAALEEARAHIAESEAELTAADTDVARAERLAATHAVSQQEVDHARRDRDAAIARRDAAAATASRLEATLAKTRIVAPIGGVVTARLVEPGEIVSAGTSLVTIADLSRTRIQAEVDEYDVGRIAIGTTVAVSAEGYGDRTWSGRVEEIPDEVVGRRLKPQDPGKPTDTRVLLVKIALSDRMPFKLGQRVEVAIGAPTTAD